MITKLTTMVWTSFGMPCGVSSDAPIITVADRATAAVKHLVAVRVRIPGIPAWSPPVC